MIVYCLPPLSLVLILAMRRRSLSIMVCQWALLTIECQHCCVLEPYTRLTMGHKMIKQANTQRPVQELIAIRWSPYAFADKDVSNEDLLCLFEAARWAPSSYNEQPWSYIVATRRRKDDFDRLLSCLLEANQLWAKSASALALGIATLNFKHDGKPNKAAVHDLGLAAGTLTLEATARGLCVHQMIGIAPETAREVYSIPNGSEAVTALAIGYAGDPSELPDALRPRDLAARERKPISEFVFGESWGKPFERIG